MMNRLSVTCLVVCCLLYNAASSLQNPCARKYFNGHDSFVCVCTSTYCDSFEPFVFSNQVTMFTTDQFYDRFEKRTLNFSQSTSDNSQVITINRDKKLQNITGFGGAFTDATGYNLLKLNEKLRENIIKDYYGSNGLMYSMGRVPIGGSDFSTHAYTYDDGDTEDFNLTRFKLTMEDEKYKIPFIKIAMKEAKQPIKLFASPWSPPAWMKTNKELNGNGSIKGETNGPYYKTWANYFVKFLDQYKQREIDFWGITIQNEPFDGEITNFTFNCNGMTAEIQRDFLYQTLGPVLYAAGYTKDKLKIMIMDDQRGFAKNWADVILGDKKASAYASGLAFHWYLNSMTSVDVLDYIHQKYPEFFLLSSEACEGSSGETEKVSLGSWQRAENYANDIIQNLQHYTTGWVDWNLALDMQGGPNWVENYVDSPIITNEKLMEYYKQPMYYALGHFTRFISPGSILLETKNSDPLGLEAIILENPINHYTVGIVLNRFKSVIPLTINDPKHGNISVEIKPKSIQTIIWQE